MEIGELVKQVKTEQKKPNQDQLQQIVDLLGPRLEESDGRALVENFVLDSKGNPTTEQQRLFEEGLCVEMNEENQLVLSGHDENKEFFMIALSNPESVASAIVTDESGQESMVIVRPGDEMETFVTRVTPIKTGH